MNKAVIYIIIIISIYSIIQIIRARIKYNNMNRIFYKRGRDTKKRDIVDSSELQKSTKGLSLTVTAWLYVDNLLYGSGNYNHILTKGIASRKSLKQTPGIWIDPVLNDIEVVVSNGLENSKFYIRDFPLRKWFSIAVVINNRIVELYLNGKLLDTYTLKNSPNLNNGGLIMTGRNRDTDDKKANDPDTNTKQYGFSGSMKNIGVYSYALSTVQIQNTHDKGHNPELLYKIMSWAEQLYRNAEDAIEKDPNASLSLKNMQKFKKGILTDAEKLAKYTADAQGNEINIAAKMALRKKRNAAELKRIKADPFGKNIFKHDINQDNNLSLDEMKQAYQQMPGLSDVVKNKDWDKNKNNKLNLNEIQNARDELSNLVKSKYSE